MNNDNHNEILGRIIRATDTNSDQWLRGENGRYVPLVLPKRYGCREGITVYEALEELYGLIYTSDRKPRRMVRKASKSKILISARELYHTVAAAIEFNEHDPLMFDYQRKVTESIKLGPCGIIDHLKLTFKGELRNNYVKLSIMAQLEALLLTFCDPTSPESTMADKRIFDMIHGTTYAYSNGTRVRLKISEDDADIYGRVKRGTQLYINRFRAHNRSPSSGELIAPRMTHSKPRNLINIRNRLIDTRMRNIWPLTGQEYGVIRTVILNYLGDIYLYACYNINSGNISTLTTTYSQILETCREHSDIRLLKRLLSTITSLHYSSYTQTKLVTVLVVCELLVSHIRFDEDMSEDSRGSNQLLKEVIFGDTPLEYITYKNIPDTILPVDKIKEPPMSADITVNRNFFSYFGTDGEEEGEIYGRLLRANERYNRLWAEKYVPEPNGKHIAPRPGSNGMETLAEVYDKISKHRVTYSWTNLSELKFRHSGSLLNLLMDIYICVANRLLSSSDRMVLTMYKNVRNKNHELPFEDLFHSLKLANINNVNHMTINNAVEVITVVDVLILRIGIPSGHGSLPYVTAQEYLKIFFGSKVPTSESVIKEELETPVVSEEVVTVPPPLTQPQDVVPSELPVMSGKFNMMFREYSSLLSTMVSWADSYCSKYGLDSEVSEHVAVGHILTGIVAARMSVYEPDNMTPELKEDVFRARYALAYLVVTNSRSPTTMLDYGKSISYASTVSSIDLINRILKALSAGRLVEEDYSYCTAAMELLTNSLNN